ncbi:MAG: TlyA family RNA methyltransferase [Nitrospirae bacterium]|nr:TlyA family RNA methyltransferase [Nitrospirota bacterium]
MTDTPSDAGEIGAVAEKDRLDKILVDKGLVKSRERAKALIMEGKVLVEGKQVTKAGTIVSSRMHVSLSEDDLPYVSRGGLKLAAALDFFQMDPEGKIVMDIGCSTGGFTDCVLKKNAAKVYAIDVGYGQFDWSLRHDPRVTLLEKTNIRHLDKAAIPEPIDLAVIDVSFISLLKVLPKALDFLQPKGAVIALIKPQFEVGKGMVEKGGIIKDESKRLSTVEKIRIGAEEMGFRVLGVFESPVHGQKGNIEYFIYLGRG